MREKQKLKDEKAAAAAAGASGSKKWQDKSDVPRLLLAQN